MDQTLSPPDSLMNRLALRTAADRLLVVAVFALPTVGVLAHKGLPLLALVMVLTLVPSLRFDEWRMPWSLKLLALPALAALIWGGLSALWAIDPGLAIGRAAKLAAATAVGVFLLIGLVNLPERQRFRIGVALCAGVALAVVIVAIDISLTGGLRRAIRNDASYFGMASLNNGMTWIVLLVWPAALWLWRMAGRTGRWWWRFVALVPIASCTPLLMYLESQSSATAFALGLATFAGVALLPRFMPYALAVGVALATMAAPALVMYAMTFTRQIEWYRELPSTVVHRIYIWDFTVQKILERSTLGWGLDSSRVIPGGDVMVTDLNPILQPWIYGKMQLMPLHPHNAPLQLWLELGIPGALLFVAITAGLLIAIALRIRDRLTAATAATVLLVAIALSSFSYGIWQTWWLAALWLVAALTAMMVRPVEQ